jgi:gamma-glutamyltranspeptidase/glutathione hydrolase
VSVVRQVAGLLNATYATERYAQFANRLRGARTAAGGTIPSGVPPGVSVEESNKLHQAPHQEQHGTSHYVIVDQWGNIASVTTTVEESLGCKVVCVL